MRECRDFTMTKWRPALNALGITQGETHQRGKNNHSGRKRGGTQAKTRGKLAFEIKHETLKTVNNNEHRDNLKKRHWKQMQVTRTRDHKAKYFKENPMKL